MSRPLLFIFFFIIFPFLGCNQSLNPSGSAPGPILAKVNGQPITLEEFNRKWALLPEAGQTIYGGADGRRDFLEELVKRELLLQKARELELDRKPAFRNRLEASRDRLLLDAILKKMVTEKIEVTEKDIEAYFEMHRNDLPPIEEIRASHILVKTEAEAKVVLDQLHGGSDFSSIAKAHSIDPGTKDKGGDLGPIRRGQMAPEIEKAVFSLNPGEISHAVRSQYGYHILRVRSRQSIKATRADEASSEIRQKIIKERQRLLFDGLITILRAEARIEIADSHLASISHDLKNP